MVNKNILNILVCSLLWTGFIFTEEKDKSGELGALALASAIRSGNMDRVKQVLQRKSVDLNTEVPVQGRGRKPLLWLTLPTTYSYKRSCRRAAFCRNQPFRWDIAELLVRLGADPYRGFHESPMSEVVRLYGEGRKAGSDVKMTWARISFLALSPHRSCRRIFDAVPDDLIDDFAALNDSINGAPLTLEDLKKGLAEEKKKQQEAEKNAKEAKKAG